MFVFTAKLTKQKLVAALLALVVIVAAIVFFAARGHNDAQSVSLSAVVKSNEERVSYLESFGWEVAEEPIEQQTIVIPKDFSQVYQKYNDLQIGQGFDLTDYAGLEAVRYTYEVLNYPSGDSTVVADMIVYRNKVIAGDVQSTSMDGFMSGLAFPE